MNVLLQKRSDICIRRLSASIRCIYLHLSFCVFLFMCHRNSSIDFTKFITLKTISHICYNKPRNPFIPGYLWRINHMGKFNTSFSKIKVSVLINCCKYQSLWESLTGRYFKGSAQVPSPVSPYPNPVTFLSRAI